MKEKCVNKTSFKSKVKLRCKLTSLKYSNIKKRKLHFLMKIAKRIRVSRWQGNKVKLCRVKMCSEESDRCSGQSMSNFLNEPSMPKRSSMFPAVSGRSDSSTRTFSSFKNQSLHSNIFSLHKSVKEKSSREKPLENKWKLFAEKKRTVQFVHGQLFSAVIRGKDRFRHKVVQRLATCGVDVNLDRNMNKMKWLTRQISKLNLEIIITIVALTRSAILGFKVDFTSDTMWSTKVGAFMKWMPFILAPYAFCNKSIHRKLS